MILTGGLLASGEIVSPGSVVWYAVAGIPSLGAVGPFVVGSILYVVASLCVVGQSAPIIHLGRQGRAAKPYLPGVFAGSIICAVIGAFAWLILPVGLELGAPFPDVTVSVGIFLAIAGALMIPLAASYFASSTSLEAG